MTPTIQDFHAECVESLDRSDSIYKRFTIGVEYESHIVVTMSDDEIVIAADCGLATEIYRGTDIRRAASILYGITGSESWLKFITGEKE